VEENVFY